MALKNYVVEQGFEIEGGGSLLTGTGAPTGTSGPTADALIGSLYMDQGAGGAVWKKQADTDSASDWERVVDETIYTALGLTFGAVDMGTYTGNIISDNVDQTTVNQELESAIEAIAGGTGSTTAVPAATPTTVSTCLVDDCNGVEWEVCVYETASEGNKEFFKLASLHDGTSGADAASVDYTVHSKLKTATIAGLTFQPVLAGTGTSQTIGLEISATAAVTVKVRRTDIP